MVDIIFYIPGDVIYDPIVGVASTGVAALQLGRRFVGVELYTTYYDAGKQRLVEMLSVV